MKVFWNDRGPGIASDSPIDVDIDKANDIWVDEVFGVKGNFYGLVDDEDRIMQFYFAEDIPDHVGDARHLKIVDIDFPCPEKGGSYTKRITIGEVTAYIEKAFTLGANPKGYDVEFISW